MEKGCVYIVLLNYRNYKDTLECLESLYKLNYPNFKIIIIDNSDNPSEIQHIERWARGEAREVESNFDDLVRPFEQKPLSYITIKENQLKNINDFEKLLIVQAEKNNGFATGNNFALR